jgi:hypothetical protein
MFFIINLKRLNMNKYILTLPKMNASLLIDRIIFAFNYNGNKILLPELTS